MNEEYFKVVLTISASISALWFLAYISCWICQRVWAWIDDSEASDRSKMVDLIMRVYGYEVRESRNYYDGHQPYVRNVNGYIDYSCGTLPLCRFVAILVLAPWVIYVAISFYNVAICLAILVLVIFLSRYVRRQKKLFDKHIVNKDAHK